MKNEIKYVNVTIESKYSLVTHRIREEFLEVFTDILCEDGVSYTIHSDN